MSVYLDHAATTAVSGEVLQAYLAALEILGNPSSTHAHGRKAWRVLDEARESIAADLGADSAEVIFTSGGTEADNLAIKGMWQGRKLPQLIVSTVEHHAVFESAQYLADHQGADLKWLEVDADGVARLDLLADHLKTHHEQVGLISLMMANNETGTIQPVADLVKLADQYGIPVHTDAVQAVGNIPVHFHELGVQALAISGHKLGSPVGVGALLATRDCPLVPVMHGGGQDRQVRSGTLNAAGAAALAAAVRLAVTTRSERTEYLTRLRSYLEQGILARIPDARVRGQAADHADNLGRLPTHSYISFPGTDADSVLFGLDFNGISASAGAACQAGVNRPSHVLMAMGDSEVQASAAVRFTLSTQTTQDDIDYLLTHIEQVVAGAKAAHATRKKE